MSKSITVTGVMRLHTHMQETGVKNKTRTGGFSAPSAGFLVREKISFLD
jgi:hypothetical protein